jgi:hypothetical protein
MHHRTNAAPSARPFRASSATPSLNGASLHRTTTPVYQGSTHLDTRVRSDELAVDWRAFAQASR